MKFWILFCFFFLAFSCKKKSEQHQQGGEELHLPFEAQMEEVEYLSAEEMTILRKEVQDWISKSYHGYMDHAFPMDELEPLSCTGKDSLGGLAVTRIDALDTLFVAGLYEDYVKGVKWLVKEVDFNINTTVSIFETNIRVVGSLLSNHLILTDQDFIKVLPLEDFEYQGELLDKAKDLVDRLLKGFETKKKIPVRSVHLQEGIPDFLTQEYIENEMKALADLPAYILERKRVYISEMGTFILEFGLLSELTGDPKYKQVADYLIEMIKKKRQKNGLLPIAIDPHTGKLLKDKDLEFTSIGSGIDSYFEYLVKAAKLFHSKDIGSSPYFKEFKKLEKSIKRYLKKGPWYVPAKLQNPHETDFTVSNLDYYFPTLYFIQGDLASKKDLADAEKTIQSYASLWQTYDFSPEKIDLGLGQGSFIYNLNPELIEALWYAKSYIEKSEMKFRNVYPLLATDLMNSLREYASTSCGFASINGKTKKRLPRMESFWLAETLKYLYLVFSDPQEDLFLRHFDSKNIVFNTEAHPLWIPTQIKA